MPLIVPCAATRCRKLPDALGHRRHRRGRGQYPPLDGANLRPWEDRLPKSEQYRRSQDQASWRRDSASQAAVDESETTGTADDDMEGIAGRPETCRATRWPAPWHGQPPCTTILPMLTGTLHEAESVGDVARVEDAVRQGSKLPGCQQLNHFGEQLARQFPVFADQLVDVDAEIGEVAPQRPQAEMGVGIEVTLAQLYEAAERSQAIHRPCHGPTGERIQHDVDAFAGGVLGDLVSEGQAARITDEVDAKIAQEGPLLVAACGRDDLGPALAGDLDRGEADCASASVDQDGLIGADLAEMDQRIVGGEECHRDRARRFEGYPDRQRTDGKCLRHYVACEALRCEGDDTIANRERIDARAAAHDGPGAFHAESGPGIAVFQSLLGLQQAAGST